MRPSSDKMVRNALIKLGEPMPRVDLELDKTITFPRTGIENTRQMEGLGISVDPLSSFPDEYRTILGVAQARCGVIFRELADLSGQSGYSTFFVNVRQANSDHVALVGNHIIKIGKLSQDRTPEPELFRLAKEKVPKEFAMKHMPEISIGPVTLGDQILVGYTIAGGSIEVCRTMSTYQTTADLKRIFRTVMPGILEDFNGNRIEYGLLARPEDVLKSVLGDCLEERLTCLLRDDWGVDPCASKIIVSTQPYEAIPNAFALAMNPKLWLSEMRSISAILGNQHFDLHLDNIVAQIGRNGKVAYWFIDFANFSARAYLLYDISYFEISFVIKQLARRLSSHVQSQPFEEFHNVVDEFVQLALVLTQWGVPTNLPIPLGLAGLYDVIISGRKSLENCFRDIEEAQPGTVSDLRSQYDLCAIAAGLNISIWPVLSKPERYIAFVLACLYARDLLQHFRIKPPKGSCQELALSPCV